MKKIIVLVFLLGMFSSVFVSCSEDTEPDKKQIIVDNDWKLTSFETEKVDETFSAYSQLLLSLATFIYDFQEDGTYTVTTSSPLTTEEETEEGTWSIADGYGTLTIDGEDVTINECTETTLKLTGEEAIVDFDGEDEFDTGKITIVFTAQQ